ncbi:DUF3099 domain-containing protein [Actinomadura alba]|uniref:DUF3099 domain-containing protein n=1 Tax=Actinomadura alba TaxID=406431 RepID=UPI0028ACDC0D|nr:DUF3099 domain-containing protein [Actinomadura alba]
MIPRRRVDVYTVTDAHRPMSEDIGYRQRRYLVSMGIRTACFLLALFLTGHAPIWIVGVLIVGAVVLPYVSVVFANGGREPENAARFDERESPNRNQISGRPPEIRS